MMISKFLSPFSTPRTAIISRKSVSMCMSDQKTIDPSPVLGSAELTIPGEVQLFSDLFTHLVESSHQTISDGIIAPYRL
jgi:hypothetical protein